jgi:hypothetical protein
MMRQLVDRRVNTGGGRAAVSSRGTVLLMVIGVLALMAIIAVVYATIGRGEKSQSTAVVRSERTGEQIGRIGEYLAGVIGEGTRSTVPMPAYEATGPGAAVVVDVPHRRAHSTPMVDDAALSVVGLPGQPGAAERPTAFNPRGSIEFDQTAPRQAGIDTRQAGDPWLAATEPSFIDLTPRLAANSRPVHLLPASIDRIPVARRTLTTGAGVALKPLSGPSASQPTELIRDWSAISNFAPSGNFVNLVNLRDNFAAPEGFVASGMSTQLSLVDTANMDRVAAPTDNNPNADLAVLRADGRAARLNRPKDWTLNQLGAFVLVDDDARPPEDPRRVSNQWADTDGDRMADARWFSLSRLVRDNANNVRAEPVVDLGGLGLRYFVAARAIDNSSLVNVNTATDFVSRPTERFLPGLTPADVDLRRLLTMQDFQQYWLAFADNTAFANLLEQAPGGWMNDPTRDVDYEQLSFGMGVVGATTSRTGRVFEVGLSAYASLQTSLAEGRTRARNNQRPYFSTRQPSAAPAPALDVQRVAPLTALDRAIRGADSAGLDAFASGTSFRQAAVRRVTGAGDYNVKRSLQLFGLDDELELRSRNGFNESGQTTRLEAALDGRLETQASTNLDKLGLMRSNRSTEVELGGDDTQRLLAHLANARRLMTTVSGARPLVSDYAIEEPSVRAARDMTSLLLNVSSGAMSDVDLVGVGPIMTERDAVNASVSAMFEAYADILMPPPPRRDVSGTPSAVQQLLPWNTGAEAIGGVGAAGPMLRASTLGYGGYTHELSMRFAAHMAVNLADMFDIDRAPWRAGVTGTVANPAGGLATVSVDEFKRMDRDMHVPTARTLLVSQDALAEAPAARQGAGYVWPTMRLANDETWRHAPANPAALTGAAPVNRVNVYGVEPQPFLVEASWLAVYVDSDGGTVTQDPMAPAEPVEFDFSPEMTNTDYIGEIIAFQMHNPFSEPVCVYRAERTAPVEAARVQYYIEYAGLTYPLGGVSDTNTPIVESVYLEPGETRVFYAANPPELANWVTRFNAATASLPLPTTTDVPEVRNWMQSLFSNQFFDPPRASIRQSRPVRVRATTDAETFADAAPGSTSATDVELVMVGPAPFRTGSTVALTGTSASAQKVVNLWRVMRSSAAGAAPYAADLPAGATLATVGTPNNPANDLLADRLRDPTGITGGVGTGRFEELKSALDGIGTDDVTGSLANDGDNTGFSMIRWAAVRRSADPVPASVWLKDASNVLPAWCMEARADNQFGRGDQTTAIVPGGPSPRFSYNTAVGEVDSLSRAEFGAAMGPFRTERFESADDMLSATSRPSYNVGSLPVLVTVTGPNVQLALPAELKDQYSTTPIPPVSLPDGTSVSGVLASARHSTPRINAEVPLAIPSLALPFLESPARLATLDGVGTRWDERAPDYYDRGLYHSSELDAGVRRPSEIRNPGLFSRSADFLLPLAIGAESVPDGAVSPQATAIYNSTGTSLEVAQRESRWMTLSEKIAMAAGYYFPTVGQAGAFELYAAAPLGGRSDFATPAAPGAAPIVLPRTDRGHLRIDAFTPAVVTNGNVESIQPTGDGVPFALGVVSKMRAGAGVSSVDPALSPSARRELETNFSTAATVTPLPAVPLAAEGSSSQAIAGVVNINTAPRQVLMTVPMLAPSVTMTRNPAEPYRAEWAAGASSVPAPLFSAMLGACCIGTAAPYACVILSEAQCVAVTGDAARWNAASLCSLGACSGSTDPAAAPALAAATEVWAMLPTATDADRAGLRNTIESARPLANAATPEPLPTPEFATPLYEPMTTGPSATSTGLKQGNAAPSYDLSATISAYRSKGLEITRLQHADPASATSGVPVVAQSNIADYSAGLFESDDDRVPHAPRVGVGVNNRNGSRTFTMTAWTQWPQEWWPTGGTADPNRPLYREAGGFASVGELALANPSLWFGAGAPALPVATVDAGVQRFARALSPGATAPIQGPRPLPAIVTGWQGVVGTWQPGLASTPPATGAIVSPARVAYAKVARPRMQGVAPGSAFRPVPELAPYDHKLAILNATTNTTSVRSDVFTVWYLVHGYSEEDVKVQAGEVMEPSVKKRFVMTVDRSNVQKAGDKPRVLMLKELPAE